MPKDYILISLSLLAQYGFEDILLDNIKKNPTLLYEESNNWRTHYMANEIASKAVYGGYLELAFTILEIADDYIKNHPGQIRYRFNFKDDNIDENVLKTLFISSINGNHYGNAKYLMSLFPINYKWKYFYSEIADWKTSVSSEELLTIFAIAKELQINRLTDLMINKL